MNEHFAAALPEPKSLENCCRLCDGSLTSRFNVVLLHKYEVAFYECKSCKSLQTESPYWLDEAYGQNLSSIDTGAAQRSLDNMTASYLVARLFKSRNAIDIGGGDGLLCRFLRDYGINCFVKDKYAKPVYAQGFTEPDFDKPDLVTAFEVLEHFANPRSDLDGLFDFKSDVLLFSTTIYRNEGEDWWYLTAESGQHVFFYSHSALELIGKRYGYKLMTRGSFILFVKSELLTKSRVFWLKVFFKPKIFRILKSSMVFRPTPGVWEDYSVQQKKSSTAQPRTSAPSETI